MILLLGLPKCGTSSFQYLFESLGYTSHHYHYNGKTKHVGMIIYHNKINNRPLLHGFSDNDVITQMDVCKSKECSYWPQILDYKQLHKENPNSIFILNKRNPKKILESFKNYKNYIGRLFKYSPELIVDKTDNGFINFVNKFYADVEKYFLSYPDTKFITYDIENDKIEKLKKYIDIKDFKKRLGLKK